MCIQLGWPLEDLNQRELDRLEALCELWRARILRERARRCAHKTWGEGTHHLKHERPNAERVPRQHVATSTAKTPDVRMPRALSFKNFSYRWSW